MLNHCRKLTDIHRSIGNHERLISVEMQNCTSLEEFPCIDGMTKLETLILSGCSRLREVPEIQMNMDNLVELSLDRTGIKVVPSSIGKYCTKLSSLDLRDSKSLESFEGNFHLLKHLEKFYINCCRELELPTEGLFDVKGSLEVLDLWNTSFKSLHQDIVSMKFLGFSPSLRRLCLGSCNWINEVNISSILHELPNLQVLDLSWNDISWLPCSLLQLSSLKFLNLSYCYNLVDLPDLPATIATLRVDGCSKLKIVDLPTNLRWLWRISLPMKSILGGDIERKVQSMIQGNAIKDYSISLCFKGFGSYMPIRDFARRTFMLELPRNWYDEFSGFLICIKVDLVYNRVCVISIEDMPEMENEDVLEVCDKAPKKIAYDMCYIYVSFGSLRHTSWWKAEHTTISFSIQMNHCYLKIELVHGRSSKGDSIQRVKGTTNSLEFWDKEPIKIICDSKSRIEIDWCHDDGAYL